MPELLSDPKEYLPCLTLGMAKASSSCNASLLGSLRRFYLNEGNFGARGIRRHAPRWISGLQHPSFMTDLLSWECHLGVLNIVHSIW